MHMAAVWSLHSCGVLTNLKVITRNERPEEFEADVTSTQGFLMSRCRKHAFGVLLNNGLSLMSIATSDLHFRDINIEPTLK